MSDEVQVEKKKRFRSPPYPSFDLERAVERTTLLDKVAQHHEVGVNALTEAWGMKSTDGQVWRSVAALIQYGLVTDSGTGKSRKFKISDSGRRIVRDPHPDSEKRLNALKSAALLPMIHKTLWDRFGAARDLSETVLKGYLTLDRLDEGDTPYSDSAADEVISCYKKTLAFAGLSDSDSIRDEGSDEANTKPEGGAATPNTVGVKVGDYIKWTSGGVDQFTSKPVDWIAEDETHLRVFGSPTGIPMNEVEVVSAPKIPASPPRTPASGLSSAAQATGGKANLNATGYVVDGRLQLSADVDADEIDALKDMLTKYQEILRMMN
ncbi:hypothetical protein [Rhodophyticola sp.]|jgi:hypothetical protein|uniref:hypothetical protein n=1 Tax=Rhodophyticola sp. TaxID=2680032 RepID=UPI003D29F7AE